MKDLIKKSEYVLNEKEMKGIKGGIGTDLPDSSFPPDRTNN